MGLLGRVVWYGVSGAVGRVGRRKRIKIKAGFGVPFSPKILAYILCDLP